MTQKKRRATSGESDPLLKGRTEQPLSSTQEIATQARHGDAGKSARPTSATQFAVYDGRDRLGAYCHDGETFIAFTRLGRQIGVFPSLAEALQAIGGAS